MARFAYKAYDAAGHLAAGEIAATTREGALEAIQRRGQVPFELKEAQPAVELPWWQRDVFGTGGLGTKKLAAFTRELASLTKAEIPADEALRIIAAQPMLPARMRSVIDQTLELVVEGRSLSEALAAQGSSFPAYYVSLIQAGEQSGSLSDVLADLTIFLDRAATINQRLGSALVYPAVLLVAALAALAVIVMVLVPAITSIFSDAGVSPPFLIRALAGFGETLSSYWTLLCVAIAVAIAAIAVGLQNAALRLRFDRFLIRLPIIGTLIERRETARFARTLSVLTRNGVPILDALSISGRVVANRAFGNAIDAAKLEVQEGSPLTAPLARSGLFPDLFLRLSAVGERTGQLDTMHLRAATIYEDAADQQIERLMSLLTPALTLLIGGCVGGLILSVMGAIFAVNDLALK